MRYTTSEAAAALAAPAALEEGRRDGAEIVSHEGLGQNRRAQDVVKEEREADKRVRREVFQGICVLFSKTLEIQVRFSGCEIQVSVSPGSGKKSRL
jgi:hypothetical protein